MSLLSLHSNGLQPPPRDNGEPPIVIGLVNNMPDKALRRTEQQFRDLIAAATGERAVTLRIFSFPGISRSDDGRQHVLSHHEDISALWSAKIDGLIVTGTEPRAAHLKDEPYWPTLSALVEWAQKHTISTVWSCLAAHAAVHYLDGIERNPLPGKLSGIFECAKAAEHPLLRQRTARWQTPHSRHNELREQDLVACGYQILARSPAAGVDIFIKRCQSLFLFLQGHPEYDGGALLREYRRDVGRFLAGESNGYPVMPRGYLDEDARSALRAFRERAERERSAALLSRFPIVAADRNPWRNAATQLYVNWLGFLAAEKSRSSSLPATAAARPPQPSVAAAYG